MYDGTQKGTLSMCNIDILTYTFGYLEPLARTWAFLDPGWRSSLGHVGAAVNRVGLEGFGWRTQAATLVD